MKKLVLLSLFILMLAACIAAQETTGRMVGTITDASGAVVPNAKITATNDSTGFSRDTITGPQGDYRLGLLPPGTYTTRIEAKGFSTVQQKGVVIEIGREIT